MGWALITKPEHQPEHVCPLPAITPDVGLGSVWVCRCRRAWRYMRPAVGAEPDGTDWIETMLEGHADGPDGALWRETYNPARWWWRFRHWAAVSEG